MKHIFTAKVVSGNLKIVRRTDFIECLESFNDKEITLTVEKKKNSRSILQNNYYWAVCVPMVREGLKQTGWKLSKEETHEFLKYKFLFKEIVNEDTGELKKIKLGSSELTTTQFMEYIADIQQFGAEDLSISIPLPNEQVNIELE